MDLTHRFSVPASIDEAWAALANLDRIAPCFPGATLTSIRGNEFAGSVKVKIGPVPLVYHGGGTFVERDSRRHRAVIEVNGTDRRGNGTLSATLTFALSDGGARTEVQVLTDLALTGKPAQFGGGVVNDVSNRLLRQFVACVTPKFAEGIGTSGYVVHESEDGIRPTIEGAPSATGTRAAFTPPSDTSRTDFEIFSSIAPTALRRFALPALGVGILIWLTRKIIRGSRREASGRAGARRAQGS